MGQLHVHGSTTCTWTNPYLVPYGDTDACAWFRYKSKYLFIITLFAIDKDEVSSLDGSDDSSLSDNAVLHEEIKGE